MPHIQVNGIRLYYEEQGNGEPLVCISGLGATHDSWTPVRSLLPQYRIITFDNRGIGQTDAPGTPCSIAQMAADTLALLDQLEREAVHLAGHSMGGAIAQVVAQRHPHRVKTLTLCNSFARAREAALFAFRTNAHLWRENVPPPLLFEIILPWLFSDEVFRNEVLVRAMIEQAQTQSPQQTVDSFERQIDSVAQFDSRPWLSEIAAPTLVVAGEQDIMTPASESQAMAKVIRNALYREVPTGHLSLVEKPEAVAKAIGDFLREH